MASRLPSAGPKLGLPPIWTIYRRPSDMPDCSYVVRIHYGLRPEAQAVPFETLNAARDAVVLSGASYCLGRQVGDDPVIVESWI